MTQNQLDRLIAMLEPQADSDAVEFVRNELSTALQSPRAGVFDLQRDGTIFPPIEDREINAELTDDWSCTPQGERSEQQRHDVYEVEEFNPNDPVNW